MCVPREYIADLGDIVLCASSVSVFGLSSELRARMHFEGERGAGSMPVQTNCPMFDRVAR